MNLFSILLHNSDEQDDTYMETPTTRSGQNLNPYPTNNTGNNKLYPCSVCNRSFTSDRIRQHESACIKAHKERRTFDSTKQRLAGTEAAVFYRKARTGKGRVDSNKPQVELG